MATAMTPPAHSFEGHRLTREMIEQIAASEGLTERQKRTVERHAGPLIQDTVTGPARLWDEWAAWCELAFAAGAEVLHERREQIASAAAAIEAAIRRGTDFARWMEQTLGHPLTGADRLPAAAEELRQFKVTVLDRWQSLDDLAEILLEKFSLSGAVGGTRGRAPAAPVLVRRGFRPVHPRRPEV